MQANCHRCGQAFETKSHRAKWCSSACRKQNQRTPGNVTELRPKQDAEGNVDAGPVFAATMAKLKAADRLHEPAGVAALALAHRLDHGGKDTGTALAAVARELTAQLEVALAGATVIADPLDELQAMRERRLAGGA